MDDLERDLDEAGRTIAPDLGAARSRLGARLGASGTGAGPGTRPRVAGSILAAAAVAVVMAGALGVTLTIRHTATGNSGGAAGSPQGSIPLAGSATETGTFTDTASSTTATATATSTVQPLETIPPATSTGTAQATSASTSGGVVVITEGTAGPVSVTRGQKVEVDLAPSGQAWSEPQSSDSSVLQRISGSTSPDGSARAVFTALADGSVTVFAAQAPLACYPHCLPPQRAIEISVTVSG